MFFYGCLELALQGITVFVEPTGSEANSPSCSFHVYKYRKKFQRSRYIRKKRYFCIRAKLVLPYIIFSICTKHHACRGEPTVTNEGSNCNLPTTPDMLSPVLPDISLIKWKMVLPVAELYKFILLYNKNLWFAIIKI